MSQCLNPACEKLNSLEQKFCSQCGSSLLLADRYRAIKFLGQGGFGRTFQAVDQYRLQTPCVIKQFLPLHQGTKALKKSQELFEQEAIQLCELGKHPQIPDLLAFFEQEGRLYLVQELIEGEDLLKELQKEGHFSEEKVKDFLLQLLPVLQFIHQKNVIHRDIKPENIIRKNLVNQELNSGENKTKNNLFLIDFGVSKYLINGVSNQMGTITGTHGYSAPEQLRGLVHPSSDLYSLAITAIRLLTGCLPIEEDGLMRDPLFNMQEMKWQWQEWLKQNQIKISSELALILDQMLQEKISDRFQTAQEILDRLNQIENKIILPQTVKIEQKISSNLGEMIGDYWQKTVNLVKEKLHPHSAPEPVEIPPTVTPNTPKPLITPKPQPIVSSPPSNVQKTTELPSLINPSFPLKSSLGIDYQNLAKILAQKHWKEADIQTYKLLLKISGRQAEGWLRPNDVITLSSIDLQTINQLWCEYSQKRFCFTTQKKIYQILRGTANYDEKIWHLFTEKVGWFTDGKWLNYSELNFTDQAPLGHFPFGGWLYRFQNVNRPGILITLLLRNDI